jgi:hypothetical protein
MWCFDKLSKMTPRLINNFHHSHAKIKKIKRYFDRSRESYRLGEFRYYLPNIISDST